MTITNPSPPIFFDKFFSIYKTGGRFVYSFFLTLYKNEGGGGGEFVYIKKKLY